MEQVAVEPVAARLQRRAWKIGRNIEGIEGKLARGDVPEDKKRLLRFNLDKACTAFRACQEDLSDFTRI